MAGVVSMTEIKARWEAEQHALSKRIITKDDFSWSLKESKGHPPLSLIGGVDISFFKGSATKACAMLVIARYPDLSIVYQDCQITDVKEPYINGFLAFREVSHLLPLIEKLRINFPSLVPQVIMVDGNGLLHQRRCGLASHLGVLCGIPTIGVSKLFTEVDSMKKEEVRLLRSKLVNKGDYVPLVGASNYIWGTMVKTTDEPDTTPVYVSIGHRISLETATSIVIACSIVREPEPIRQADRLSREVVKLVSSGYVTGKYLSSMIHM